MDRTHFDAFAKLFSTQGSRRATLAAVFSAAVLGHDADTLFAARNKHGRKHRRRRKNRQSDIPFVPIVEVCFAGTNCVPGRGRTNSDCDFSNSTVFVDLDARGSVLDGANFTGANLAGADLRGAVLTGACFVDANLTGATIDNSTLLDEAIFCNVVTPDGSILNSGCGRQSGCCKTTCEGGSCPADGCNPIDNFCGSVAGPCCENLECVNPPFSICTHYCRTDRECSDLFGSEYFCSDVFAGCRDRKCCGRSL